MKIINYLLECLENFGKLVCANFAHTTKIKFQLLQKIQQLKIYYKFT